MKKYRALSLLVAIGMLLSSAALAPTARAQGVSTLVIDFTVEDPAGFRPLRFELVRMDEGDPQVVHAAEVDEPSILDFSVPAGRYLLYVQDKETGIIEQLPTGGPAHHLSVTRSSFVHAASMIRRVTACSAKTSGPGSWIQSSKPPSAKWNSFLFLPVPEVC